MIRRLFAAASVLSLMLFLTTIVLWGRGRTPRDDHLQIAIHGHFLDLNTFRNDLSLEVVDRWPGQRGIWLTRCSWDDYLNNRGPDRFEFAGNQVVNWQRFGIEIVSGIRVPFCDDNGIPRRGANREPPLPPILPFWGVHFVPFGMLAAVTSLAPGAWLIGFLLPRCRRARRGRLHLCTACGYDLRASTNRCPECGSPIQAEATA